jgi:hypothetical protein
LDEKGERKKDRKTVTLTMREKGGKTRRLFSIYFFKKKGQKGSRFTKTRKSLTNIK